MRIKNLIRTLRRPPPPNHVQKWIDRGKPSWDSDCVVTWQQSLGFMDDLKFRRAYDRGMDSGHQIVRAAGSKDDLHIEWRVHVLSTLAWHAARLEGDFVECGVNTGIFSLAICHYLDFNKLDKSFYLFDTFNGIPVESMSETERSARIIENSRNYPECFDTAKQNFAPFPRAVLVRGRVPETLPLVHIDKVAYLHLDMNVAAPERAAIEYFWPKIVPGGVLAFDDYGWAPYKEQKDALDAFAEQQGVKIMLLPTGQGILIKS
jgi:O-methyltransferase